jgi:hypothetical protein
MVGARSLHSHLPGELVGRLSKRLVLAPHLASFSIFICHRGTHPGRHAERLLAPGRLSVAPGAAGGPVARTS